MNPNVIAIIIIWVYCEDETTQTRYLGLEGTFWC